MIFVKNTPNNTGVAIYGDYMDFENLYEVLHAVVGVCCKIKIPKVAS